MSELDPAKTSKNKKTSRALVAGTAATLAVGLAAAGLTRGGDTPEKQPTRANQTPLITLLMDGGHRHVTNVALDPSVATLENVAEHPFAQTTAQTAVEITKKETWKDASIIIARDTDGQLGAFLAKAVEGAPLDPQSAEAIQLNDANIAAVTVEGEVPTSVDALLQGVPGIDADYEQLAQEFVQAPAPRVIID